MRRIISILGCCMIGCGSPTTEAPAGVLSENDFSNIIKEIHLAEAAFELSVDKSSKNEKAILANYYESIYKRHNINDSIFSNSLDYYSKNPKKLEKIYANILKILSDERATLDQQETN